jgi:glycosyltransferase involved in cell wall biosynthesis
MSRWLCCQLSAREHYAVPRALHAVGRLRALITDAWVGPRYSKTFFVGQSLAGLGERYHPDLENAPVNAFAGAAIKFELERRLRGIKGWEAITKRNAWFQHRALAVLNSLDLPARGSSLTMFAYSYAAAELFHFAKSRGWYTVLGQIDGGPYEEEIVQREHSKNDNYKSDWKAAPTDYWRKWREECSLADRIIVNSSWSSKALQATGIEAHKICVIPLAYEPHKEASSFVRMYPLAFSRSRPLRVLFLGQVIVRKGVIPLLEAARLLRNEPIEFWFVGPVGVTTNGTTSKNVRWVGPVPRNIASRYYEKADVFILPTFSDGFGLTQLEARAWKLPIIASRFCGQVVRDQENGLLLDQITPEAIVGTLLYCLNNPGQLQSFSDCAMSTEIGAFAQLQKSLQFIDYSFDTL